MHPRIHAYGEVFHNDPAKRVVVNGRSFSVGEDGGKFCHETIYRLPNEKDKETLGFKIFFFHARQSEQEYNAWRYLVEDRCIRVLMLFRNNLFDSFVSVKRSMQSDVWFLKQGERPPAIHLSPLTIDPEECKRYMDHTVAEIQWAREQFKHHSLIQLNYEDLQQDLIGSLNMVFGFLEEDRTPIALTFQKVNTVPHAEGIVNYQDLVRDFRFSIFREYFNNQQDL